MLQDLVLTPCCMEMNLENMSAASLPAVSHTRPGCVSTFSVCPHTPVQQHLFFIPALWLEVWHYRDNDDLALCSVCCGTVNPTTPTIIWSILLSALIFDSNHACAEFIFSLCFGNVFLFSLVILVDMLFHLQIPVSSLYFPAKKAFAWCLHWQNAALNQFSRTRRIQILNKNFHLKRKPPH